MEKIKERLFKELVKNGYSQVGKTKIWDISNRSLLYLTDELANKFLAFRNYPRYKRTIVDIESSLIKENSEKLISVVGKGPFNLIDMGCGDGSKANVFINSSCNDCIVRFCPVNVNKMLVDLALKNVKDAGFKSVVDYHPEVAELEDVGDITSMMRSGDYQKNVVLLFGSLLASFDIHDYLFRLSQAMWKGDILIIGNSIRTGERFVNLETYKHEIFQDWLIPLMRHLGFSDEDLEYDARFANGRVEGFFRIKKNTEIDHGGNMIAFNKEDEVVVGKLYKYYEPELMDFCKMYFRDVEILKDKESEHALIICKK